MDNLILREAKFEDYEEIAVLCNQLGYQTESSDIPHRLKQINDLDQHAVFVAELDHRVIGWIHVYVCPLLVSPHQSQLGGLVVHEDQRGKGIGEKLMEQAEAWSRTRSCQLLTVYTNIIRNRTHGFYENLGYQNIKTEYLMRKEL
jgi:GNAT superfamily N-acetyltransferase